MMVRYCCWRCTEYEMLDIMVSKAQMHNETRYESRKRSIELSKE